MNTAKYSKLRTLVNEVPQGCIIDGDWLDAMGIGRVNARSYVNSGWLERIACGVYRRPFPDSSPEYGVEWDTVLRSLRWLMGWTGHIGGESALSHHGYNHDMKFWTLCVFVHGDPLPSWIDRIPCGQEFYRRPLTLFTGPRDMGVSSFRPQGDTVPARWPLWYSRPERALLEAMAEVPQRVDFYRIDKVVQSMWSRVSADNFNELLQACTSYKVRRLFCAFAARHDHHWWSKIDLDNLDLGRGVSYLARQGGKIHPDFQVKMPEEFIGAEREHCLEPGEVCDV
ncbi:MAG: type IV toxin-antitoxin system AbiEi family antitoxin domain-containing protein [Bacteroidota bacterium]|nr:type IV toxin-antitoxin system AbiEi family antitoxin domain-containing protein [Bacteroidota bacterium]